VFVRRKQVLERNDVVSEVCGPVSRPTCQLSTPVRACGNDLAIKMCAAASQNSCCVYPELSLHSVCINKADTFTNGLLGNFKRAVLLRGIMRSFKRQGRVCYVHNGINIAEGALIATNVRSTREQRGTWKCAVISSFMHLQSDTDYYCMGLIMRQKDLGTPFALAGWPDSVRSSLG
jgi:hypothetical protein